jgi:uncharacterized protein YceH (UPF0502 family)
MPLVLSDKEARVIGCLMEKSVITPDQYPMTLNALTNACNQKSSRDPVMHLTSGEVLGTLRSLQDKRLVRVEENFKTQVEKFTQRLCNTPFSDYQFDAAQFAVMTVLLLRGPRTPGELKANVGRLHTFTDNDEVQETLGTLIEREEGPVVARLPRRSGRRDHEYMHLLGGEVNASDADREDLRPAADERVPAAAVPSRSADTLEVNRRLAELETEVAGLKSALASLRAELGDGDSDD